MEAGRDVVALHATDPATVHLSAAARMREPDVAAVERALYDERSLIRMLGMRRTMFVVPTSSRRRSRRPAPTPSRRGSGRGS